MKLSTSTNLLDLVAKWAGAARKYLVTRMFVSLDEIRELFFCTQEDPTFSVVTPLCVDPIPELELHRSFAARD